MPLGKMRKRFVLLASGGGLISSLYLLLQGSSIQIGLGLISSILRVRALGAEWYGKTAFVVTVLALLPTTYELFNDTLLRFYRESPDRTRKRLFMFSIGAKFLLYLVVGAGLTVMVAFSGVTRLTNLLRDDAIMLYVVCYGVGILLDLFRSSLLIVLKSEGRYARFVTITAGESLFGTVFAAFVLGSGLRGREAVGWLGAYVLVNSVIQLSLVFWLVNRETTYPRWIAKSSGNWIKSSHYVFHRYFRPYSLPLSPGIVFAYIKKNLGALVLGTTAGYEEVAYYKVLMRVVDVLMALIPKAAHAILPAAIEARKRAHDEFERKYMRLGIYYLLGVGAVSVVMYLATPIILSLYGLPPDPDIFAVVLVLGLLLFQHCLGFLVNFLYNMSSNRWPTYVMIPASNFVFVGALWLLAPLGLFGVALAHLIQRFTGMSLQASFGVFHMRVMSIRQFLRFATWTLALSLGLILLHFGRGWLASSLL